MADELSIEKILETNLKYFEIHAAQRLTIFNFYIAISGAILAAMAAAVQSSTRYAFAAFVLGLLLVIISFLFAKLDRRTAFLVKHAEGVIKEFEGEFLPQELRVFGLEDGATQLEKNKARFPLKMYTYGQLFRSVFVIFGIMGLAGSLLAGLQAFGAVDWSEKTEPPARVVVDLQIPPYVVPPHGMIVLGNDAGGSPRLPNNVGKVASESNALSQTNSSADIQATQNGSQGR